MLNIILDRSSILKYQNILDSLISLKLNERNINVIGFPGGARQETVCFSQSLGMWYTTSMDVDGTERVWNSFGLQNPYEVYNLNIAVEINFPFVRKGDVNGVFLKDEEDNIYVGHRGLVNIGGRKSIKRIYDQYFGGVQECIDDNGNSEIIIISPLQCDKLAENIQVFVKRIATIKEEFRNGKWETHEPPENSYGFAPEPTLRKPATINQIIEYNLEHGRIVNQLRETLSEFAQVENNKNIDLLIRNSGGVVTHVFEVKTSISTQSVYTAIGQLYFNSLSFSSSPVKVFVCPDILKKQLRNILRKLFIRIATFSVDGDKYIFYGIDQL